MKKVFLIDFSGFIIVKVLSFLFRYIPLKLSLWIGRCIGDLACFMNTNRRAIAYANVKSVFPDKKTDEIKKIVRVHFENLGMNIVELLKFPSMTKEFLSRCVTIKYMERLDSALGKGKGVIVLSAHFGNWEISSLVLGAKGYAMSVFAREQKYRMLNNLLNEYREMTGCKVVSKGFSVRDIIKDLNNNRIIGMLVDQDAGRDGVFVNLLGRPASTAKGALSFSMRTGAVILPSFGRRVGYDKHILEIGEPLELLDRGNKDEDIKANLQRIADRQSDYIKRFPEQWLWAHKRWKSTSERRVLVLSDGKRGHINQSMAVAEMVKDALSLRLKEKGIAVEPVVKINIVELNLKSRLARFVLDMASFFSASKGHQSLAWLRFCLEKDAFENVWNKYADIVISCGSGLASANIFLSAENNAKGIVIMKPDFGRRRKFDLVILPRHDISESRMMHHHTSGIKNILITESAPNRITEEAIKKAMLVMPITENRLPNSSIGLLIGGDTHAFKLRKETVERVVEGLLKIAYEFKSELFVSTSRRTSDEITCFLKDKIKGDSRCGLLVIANEKNIDNIVPAIFGLSRVVIVSPDSMSMVSEAASSGRYVVVFRENERLRAPGRQSKYEKSIKNLEEKGYIKTAEVGDIYTVVKRILEDKPPVKKLKDRKRIIESLKEIV